MSLSDEIAIVTGACGGIGSAITSELLSRGAKVIMADINGEDVAKTFEKSHGEANVAFKYCNVRKEEEFRAVFEECIQRFGKVSLLVNSAGIGSANKDEDIIDINLTSCIRGTNLALERMNKTNGHSGGAVINLASITGAATFPLSPVYSASKAGLVQHTRVLADMYDPEETGFRIHAVCPYFVETDMLKGVRDLNRNLSDWVKKRVKVDAPILKPEEVGRVVADLVKERKSGRVIVMNPDEDPFHVPPTRIEVPDPN